MTLATAFTSVTRQLHYTLCHKVFICTHHLPIPHWHLPSRLFSNTAIMDKPYGRNKCSESNLSLHRFAPHVQTQNSWLQGYAAYIPSTPYLALCPYTLQTVPTSISIPNKAPTFPQEWLPKLSVQLRHHEYIHGSHMDFHPIQANSALLAGQVTLWLPDQETDPLDLH